MFGLISEWLARIEHKVDAVLIALKITTVPMQFVGNQCPACRELIDYQVDVTAGMVIRKCGCKTGKVVTIPLKPINTTGELNGIQEGTGSGQSRSPYGKRSSGGEEG